MYTALYRTWRPETFASMSGQTHIIRILKNQLASGQIGHAYLFCGTRGTGKTTAARIFAKGVNCLSEDGVKPCGRCEPCMEIQKGTFIDVLEIDAASNNGVENIRELRESVRYPPAKGRCKVYIIDEVHMLSPGAFNALLKTLEEPPPYVLFILATTEIHKIPPTILSRCLRLDFRRLSEKDITGKMREICAHNHIEAEESALSLIAANADGAMRDALGILDQCFSAARGKVSRSDVTDILGTAGEEMFLRITERTIAKDAPAALSVIDAIAMDGKDIRQFLKDWTFHFRNLMIAKYADRLEDIINLSCEDIEKIRRQSESCSMEFISFAVAELSKASSEARWSIQPRTLLEMAVVKMTDLREETSSEALAARVADLERQIARGAAQAVPGQASGVPAKPAPDSADAPVPDSAESHTKPAKPQTKASAAAKAKRRPEAADPVSDADLDRLWEQIFQQGSAKKITFNMLAKGVSVAELDDQSIMIEAETPPKLSSVEQNANLIRDIVQNITGKNLRVQCRIAGKTAPAETADAGRKDAVIEELGKRIGSGKLIITD